MALTNEQEVNNAKEHIFTVINEKEYTPYDFWKTLNKYRAKQYFSVLKIISADGLNILQLCIDKGRLSFLPVVVQIGWWKMLSQLKIPENSSSDHKGRTAKQIAENKRAKKPLDDFNSANEWENSLSPLMKAIRSGDVSKIQQILNSSGEENFYCDYNNGNALYWVVVTGNKGLFLQLLEAGVDPGMRTKKKESLLHVACSFGQHSLIEVIVQRCQIDPWTEDNGHKTAMDRVAENGDIQTLNVMMKCGVHPRANCPVLSAYTGRELFVTYCLETLMMDKESKDLYDRTPLHRACEGVKLDIVRYLVQLGAMIHVTTCILRNLLHIAAEQGNMPLMVFVISLFKGKNILSEMISQQDRFTGVELCFLIRGRDKGRDAWHYVEVDRTLVPIFLAKTKSGNVDVANYGEVIKSGWGVNPTQDVIEEVEDMFKERRLDSSAARDMTPLHIALFKGNDDVAQLLIENGADVNMKDKFGNTPLMIAASKGSKEIVNLLEKRGAIYNEVNLGGKSAADIADSNEYDEVVNMLKGRENDQVIQTFLTGNVANLEKRLSPAELDKVRRQGGDVRRHVIDSLRDLRIDINQILVEVGSGPVLEATDDVG